MKVYVDTHINSRGIQRVVSALKKYAPRWVSIVDKEDDADVVILHVNGRLNHLRKKIDGIDKPYVIIQYSLWSTMNPDPMEWLPIWKDADLVWSYYDLGFDSEFNFYHAPLGAEDIFKPIDTEKKYTICTHGTYMTESVRECIAAAEGGKVAYLNDDVKRKHIDIYKNISDEKLNEVYNQSFYVSGLRRKDGFELPVVEGLFAGCRPICFDVPRYRQWFDGLAEFIPESHRADVIESLKGVFSGPYRSVTPEEISVARSRFNWSTIIDGLYRNIEIYCG